LGRTGLNVSAVSFGTVSLGLEYGIAAPGDHGKPPESDVAALLRRAVESGINFFDTAPGYGDSERLLGELLPPRWPGYIATKVPVPRDPAGRMVHGAALVREVRKSMETSLRVLRRPALDVLQIHNATVETIARGEMAEVLRDAREEGLVRFLGASVYTEAEALAVIDAGVFDVLQVAYNVLDQRMAEKVFTAAERAGTGIVVRSALLKGALTSKAKWLPAELSLLRAGAERAMDALAGTWESLPEAALRFCLSTQRVSTVLAGIRTARELDQALGAAEAGPLPEDRMERTRNLALQDERLLNPVSWPAG
jgi:aryl-alcohol dehydrogenase-like predicted oxidoreductase